MSELPHVPEARAALGHSVETSPSPPTSEEREGARSPEQMRGDLQSFGPTLSRPQPENMVSLEFAGQNAAGRKDSAGQAKTDAKHRLLGAVQSVQSNASATKAAGTTIKVGGKGLEGALAREARLVQRFGVHGGVVAVTVRTAKGYGRTNWALITFTDEVATEAALRDAALPKEELTARPFELMQNLHTTSAAVHQAITVHMQKIHRNRGRLSPRPTKTAGAIVAAGEQQTASSDLEARREARREIAAHRCYADAVLALNKRSGATAHRGDRIITLMDEGAYDNAADESDDEEQAATKQRSVPGFDCRIGDGERMATLIRKLRQRLGETEDGVIISIVTVKPADSARSADGRPHLHRRIVRSPHSLLHGQTYLLRRGSLSIESICEAIHEERLAKLVQRRFRERRQARMELGLGNYLKNWGLATEREITAIQHIQGAYRQRLIARMHEKKRRDEARSLQRKLQQERMVSTGTFKISYPLLCRRLWVLVAFFRDDAFAVAQDELALPLRPGSAPAPAPATGTRRAGGGRAGAQTPMHRTAQEIREAEKEQRKQHRAWTRAPSKFPWHLGCIPPKVPAANCANRSAAEAGGLGLQRQAAVAQRRHRRHTTASRAAKLGSFASTAAAADNSDSDPEPETEPAFDKAVHRKVKTIPARGPTLSPGHGQGQWQESLLLSRQPRTTACRG